MNILLLVPEFPPTPWGLANYSYDIARHLGMNNLVTVGVCPSDYVPKKYVLNLFYIYRMAKKINELKKMEGIDIVYAITFGPTFLVVGFYTRIAGVPIVFHGVGTDIYKANPVCVQSRKLAYSISQSIVCGANFQGEIMVTEGAPREKINVVHGGVDTRTFRPFSDERKRFRQIFETDDKFVLLSIGRLARRKGFDVAIRALALLDDIKDIILLIVGEGPAKPSLTKIVKDLAIDEKVKFLGYLPSSLIPKIYNVADVLVAPFREIGRDMEGFPLVVQEAQACGLPVVSTNSAGVPELVEDGKTGLIVQTNSPKRIAESIRLLYEDERLRTDLANESRKKAEKFLDWKIVIKKIDRILEEACT